MRVATIIATTALVLGTVSLTGIAVAAEPQGKAAGHGCDNMNTPEGEAKNPGKMFQDFKNSELNAGGFPNFFQGMNPAEIAKAAGNIDTNKVKQFIEIHCDNSPT